MRPREALEMLTPAALGSLGPTTWADLGCGDGTFTRALAELLAAGSVIHAVDRDRSALRALPSRHGEAEIIAHHADFTRQPWPVDRLDGLLMANSLHYVRDQAMFLRQATARMRAEPRMLIVEYDLAVANPWVPFPIDRARLAPLFEAAGYSSITILATRPSRYQRGSLYSALITR